MMYLAGDLLDLLQARATDGSRAFHFVETLFARIIATLKRHPRLAGITLLELELFLADERCEAERILFNELHNRISLTDAEDAVRRVLPNDEDY